MKTIVDFYNRYSEEDRFQKHSRKIEFLTTIEALMPYLSSPKHIIELGAGTGAYSVSFARQGHFVTAVDLVPSHVEQIIEKIKIDDDLHLDTLVGDATFLPTIKDESYDIVLCLGPYYHITSNHKREQLIRESLRILKPNGFLALAYLNKYSVLPMLVKKQPEYVNEYIVDQVINKGFIDGEDARSFWIDSHYTTPHEIEHYIGSYPVDIVDHLGTDGICHTLSEEIDSLSDEQYKLYCSYHFKTCREPSILGVSSHGLIIAKKQ